MRHARHRRSSLLPLALLCLCGALLPWPPPLGAQPATARYVIDMDSPESWVDYYQRIGLGTVHRGPLSRTDWQELTAHCMALEGITGEIWIPLGYSLQRGYKLCFRTGPFSADEARVMCARLVMRVHRNGKDAIVCKRSKANLLSPEENPYYWDAR